MDNCGHLSGLSFKEGGNITQVPWPWTSVSGHQLSMFSGFSVRAPGSVSPLTPSVSLAGACNEF